ncbi:MAG: cytochrome c [Deltaproteobacteria bacterium]|nr:cytochrome c [Deltaproteobacteria bacterium]
MNRLLLASVFALVAMYSGSAMAAADGAAIYKTKCVACHGAAGVGTPMGPAHAGNEFIKKSKPEEIASVIKNGREGAAKKYKQFAMAMPKQVLADDEVKALVEYMKSLNK